MKTAILTFHRAFNYGALLQAYALQSYLTETGYGDVSFIDYALPGERDYSFRAPRTSNPAKRIIAGLRIACHRTAIQRRGRRFSEFLESRLHLSHPDCQSREDVASALQDYDVWVTGSDQVFNPRPDSDIFYLAFQRGKRRAIKVAYAASFGLSELSAEQSARVRPWLEDFDYLSSREAQGCEIIRTLTGREAAEVCDPVALLPRERWLQIADMPKKKTKSFIFLFDLNGGRPLQQLARELQRQTGLEVVYTSPGRVHNAPLWCKRHFDLGPAQWLGHIAAADYVVTDSFHGCMLSLVLGTRLLTRPASLRTTSRITSVMSRLGLESQIVTDTSALRIGDIPFTDYTGRLAQFTAASRRYLEDILKDAAASAFAKTK